jgi:cell division protein FtsB
MEKLGHEGNKVVKRGSAATGKRKRDDSAGGAGRREDVVALKKQITRLEAENRQLRKQIATLTDSMNRSSPSSSDSVREQQHNFFKYSNVRRY